MKNILSICILLFTAIPANAVEKPLKVFILAGQSNMQGHAEVRTFDYIGDDPQTEPLLKLMRKADGTPTVVEGAWISSVGCAGDGWSDVIEQTGKLTAGFGASPEKIGPEFTFGLMMSKELNEPILIIKTAWGGRSLVADFRPLSAGERVFNDFTQKQWKERDVDPVKEAARHNAEINGVFYRHMIAHIKHVLSDITRVVPDYDPKRGYEIAGFVWFQGFNDYVDGWSYPHQNQADGYDEYSQLLAHLIRDVRKDLDAPKLPFVIGVMGIGGVGDGASGPQANFRNAQSKVADLDEFQGNVVAVKTAPFWSNELGEIEKKQEQVNQMRYFLDSNHPEHANADGKMTDDQKNEFMKEYESRVISEKEAALWKRGASNGGYHYLGCAKTFAQIGKAFAEANLELLAKQKQK